MRRRARKSNISQLLSKQLVNLWRTKHPLRQRVDQAFIYGTSLENSPTRVGILKSTDANSSRIGMERLATNFKIGERRFLPIVTQEEFLVCGLDILLLLTKAKRELRGARKSPLLRNGR